LVGWARAYFSGDEEGRKQEFWQGTAGALLGRFFMDDRFHELARTEFRNARVLGMRLSELAKTTPELVCEAGKDSHSKSKFYRIAKAGAV
jgi:hypothetical protein